MPMMVMVNPKLVFIISVVLLIAFLIAGDLLFHRKKAAAANS